MTPAAPEPAALTDRLRQQLILAQVRIMELEDTRDALAPKLAELEDLVRTAQQLADQKLDEAAHAGRVLTDTEAHAANLDRQLAQASHDLAAQAGALAERANSIARLEAELVTTRAQLDAERARVAETEAQLARVTTSRSWRWTAWLRALGDSP